MCVTTRHLGLELYNLQVNIYSHSCIDWNKDLDVLLEIRVVYLQMYVYIYIIYVYNDIISFALHFVHFVHLLLSFKEWPSSFWLNFWPTQLPQSETPFGKVHVRPPWHPAIRYSDLRRWQRYRVLCRRSAAWVLTFLLWFDIFCLCWRYEKTNHLNIKHTTTTFYMLL